MTAYSTTPSTSHDAGAMFLSSVIFPYAVPTALRMQQGIKFLPLTTPSDRSFLQKVAIEYSMLMGTGTTGASLMLTVIGPIMAYGWKGAVASAAGLATTNALSYYYERRRETKRRTLEQALD